MNCLSRKPQIPRCLDRRNASVPTSVAFQRMTPHNSHPAEQPGVSHDNTTPAGRLGSSVTTSGVPPHSAPTTVIEIISSDEDDCQVPSASLALKIPSVLRPNPRTSQQSVPNAISRAIAAITPKARSSGAFTSNNAPVSSPSAPPAPIPSRSMQQPTADFEVSQTAQGHYWDDQQQTKDDLQRSIPLKSSSDVPPGTDANAPEYLSNVITAVEPVAPDAARKPTVQEDNTKLDPNGSASTAVTPVASGEKNLLSSASPPRMNSPPLSPRTNDSEDDALVSIP